MVSYATPADLNGVVTPVPANAELLIARASRDIDRALLSAVYDPSDPDVIEALRLATVEQVAGTLDSGDKNGLGVAPAPKSFTIGRLSVQHANSTPPQARRTGRLVDQAFTVLQTAGLTGHAPRQT
ncbi:MAG: hypothetical protein ABW000_07255 [Actinoplanes sp.]